MFIYLAGIEGGSDRLSPVTILDHRMEAVILDTCRLINRDIGSVVNLAVATRGRLLMVYVARGYWVLDMLGIHQQRVLFK